MRWAAFLRVAARVVAQKKEAPYGASLSAFRAVFAIFIKALWSDGLTDTTIMAVLVPSVTHTFRCRLVGSSFVIEIP